MVTNDYNLNKVELQGVKVLNINELANAVKLYFLVKKWWFRLLKKVKNLDKVSPT